MWLAFVGVSAARNALLPRRAQFFGAIARVKSWRRSTEIHERIHENSRFVHTVTAKQHKRITPLAADTMAPVLCYITCKNAIKERKS